MSYQGKWLPAIFHTYWGKRVRRTSIGAVIIGVFIVSFLPGGQTAAPQNQPTASNALAPRAILDKYCVTCHNQKLRTAGLALDTLDVTAPSANAETWERVIGKLRAGSMPPPGNPRPDVPTYRAMASWLEN